MPDMTGLDMLQKYKKEPYFEKIPVVIITSSDSVEDQLEAFEAGANDFVTKPFMPEIIKTRVMNVVKSTRKILDIQREREALKVQTEIDQMTGLFNKNTAYSNIINDLSLYPRGIHALLMIDIDNFKSVNDNEGHMAGDQTIKVIANQIMAQFRKSDVISRFGGDEFSVFMRNLPNKDIARKKAQELAVLLKYKPNLTLPANVSVSIGIGFSDRESISYEKLLERADKALYNAKESGKARVCEYGQNSVKAETLNQEVVLLITRNRNVTSNIHATLGMSNAIVECGTINNLEKMEEIAKEKLVLTFIDLSGEKDNGENLLMNIADKYEWIMQLPFICCYEEGKTDQARIALKYGTTDILAIPFDMKAVQRMAERYLPQIKDKTKEIITEALGC